MSRDPIANVLPLGDLYQPLLGISDIYCAIENNRVNGVCSIYHAYSVPSVVFGAILQNVKKILIEKALDAISETFISLCQPHDVGLFCENSVILQCYSEQQMIVEHSAHTRQSKVKALRVTENDLKSLAGFYLKHQAKAWTPIQFRIGPYYCVKHEGKIVSVAGVHTVTPKIAQLGNVITDENWRNHGFATACVAALIKELASSGRIISLFVRADNRPAIHMYEKLGLTKIHDINFLTMQKK